jgi:hypothetical protein
MSANRDAATFDEPFRFDIGRSRNVAWPWLRRACLLGASLARMEMRLAFRRTMARIETSSPRAGRLMPSNRLLAFATCPEHPVSQRTASGGRFLISFCVAALNPQRSDLRHGSGPRGAACLTPTRSPPCCISKRGTLVIGRTVRSTISVVPSACKARRMSGSSWRSAVTLSGPDTSMRG